MHRLQVSYSTPADAAHFMRYYQDIHLPLARRLPGLLACRWMQPQALGPGVADFLVFEADFANEAAMFQALGSPQGAAVAADVPNYAPGGARLQHYAVPEA